MSSSNGEDSTDEEETDDGDDGGRFDKVLDVVLELLDFL